MNAKPFDGHTIVGTLRGVIVIAGAACDGQVLVCHDALGLSGEYSPPFAKRYAQLGELVSAAAHEYIDEVRSGVFPAPAPK